jgi:hypothetical protein
MLFTKHPNIIGIRDLEVDILLFLHSSPSLSRNLFSQFKILRIGNIFSLVMVSLMVAKL